MQGRTGQRFGIGGGGDGPGDGWAAGATRGSHGSGIGDSWKSRHRGLPPSPWWRIRDMCEPNERAALRWCTAHNIKQMPPERGDRAWGGFRGPRAYFRLAFSVLLWSHPDPFWQACIPGRARLLRPPNPFSTPLHICYDHQSISPPQASQSNIRHACGCRWQSTQPGRVWRWSCPAVPVPPQKTHNQKPADRPDYPARGGPHKSPPRSSPKVKKKG